MGEEEEDVGPGSESVSIVCCVGEEKHVSSMSLPGVVRTRRTRGGMGGQQCPVGSRVSENHSGWKRVEFRGSEGLPGAGKGYKQCLWPLECGEGRC